MACFTFEYYPINIIPQYLTAASKWIFALCSSRSRAMSTLSSSAIAAIIRAVRPSYNPITSDDTMHHSEDDTANQCMRKESNTAVKLTTFCKSICASLSCCSKRVTTLMCPFCTARISAVQPAYSVDISITSGGSQLSTRRAHNIATSIRSDTHERTTLQRIRTKRYRIKVFNIKHVLTLL